MDEVSDVNAVLNKTDRQVLQKVCDEVGVPAAVVAMMLVVEHRVYGMGRRHGIWEDLEALIDEGVRHSTRTGEDEHED